MGGTVENQYNRQENNKQDSEKHSFECTDNHQLQDSALLSPSCSNTTTLQSGVTYVTSVNADLGSLTILNPP